jgi:hypothetical protein
LTNGHGRYITATARKIGGLKSAAGAAGAAGAVGCWCLALLKLNYIGTGNKGAWLGKRGLYLCLYLYIKNII